MLGLPLVRGAVLAPGTDAKADRAGGGLFHDFAGHQGLGDSV